MSAFTLEEGCDSSFTDSKEPTVHNAFHGITASASPKSLGKLSSTSRAPKYGRFVVVVTMHALLIAVFIALICLRYRHHDQPLPLPNKHFVTALLFEKAVVSVNSIFKVYWAALLIVTQTSALKNTLHSLQSLTAMHDKVKTWSSSVYKSPLVLFEYRALFKAQKQSPEGRKKEVIALGNLLCIILYLIAGEGLGYLAPALVLPTPTLGNPNSFQNLTLYIENIGRDPNQIQEAFPVVNVLPLVADGNVVTMGLQDNLIYDVPNSVSTAPIPANGAAFNVACYSLPDAVQAGGPNHTDSTYPIHISDSLRDISVSPTSRTLNIRSASWANASSNLAPPSTLIVASTFPVYDNNSIKASTISLNPEIIPTQCVVDTDCSSIASVQVMACDVGYVYLSNAVSVITDEYPFIAETDGDISPLKGAWEDWTVPDKPTDPSLATIWNFGALAPPSHTTQQFKLADTGELGTNTLSILEDNLMETLMYYRADVESVDLSALEYTLGQAIATVYWRAATRSWDNLPVIDSDTSADDVLSVTVSISKNTPWVGLSLAIAMTILAIHLTIPPRTVSDIQVKSTSILELTWLLGSSDANIAHALYEKAKDPSMDNLREAGKAIPVVFRDC